MGSAKIGNLSLGKSFWGSKEVNAIYYGTTKIYEKTQPIPTENEYITLMSDDSFSLDSYSVSNMPSITTDPPDIDNGQEYSYDKTNWSTRQCTRTSTEDESGTTYTNTYQAINSLLDQSLNKYVIYLRCKYNTTLTSIPTTYRKFIILNNSNNPVYISGNAKYVFDYENNRPYCKFTYMFANSTASLDISNLDIPMGDYSNMFSNTNIVSSSYTMNLLDEITAGDASTNYLPYFSNMFENCVNPTKLIFPNVESLAIITSGYPILFPSTITSIEFTNKLTTITGSQIIRVENIYLDISANESVSFNITTALTEGTNKTSKVYNIYTDNLMIKDQVDNFGGQYTTINIYKYDGSSW